MTNSTMNSTTGVNTQILPVMNQRSSGEEKPSGVPLRIEQRRALQHAVHGERHDDRRQAEEHDAEAVDEPDDAGRAASTIGSA